MINDVLSFMYYAEGEKGEEFEDVKRWRGQNREAREVKVLQ